MKSVPVERHANFCQKYLQVFAAQVLFRRNADFLQNVTTPDAGVRVNPRERIIVIPRFKVRLFLLGELRTHPSHKRCLIVMRRTRNIVWTNTNRLPNAA